MDYSLPSSFVHGISQAGILEWIAISSLRESSRPWNWNCISCVSCIAGRVLTAEPFKQIQTTNTVYHTNFHFLLCREPAWGIPTVTRSCGRDLMGKANQISGLPPGISWACTPQKTKSAGLCTLLFRSSDTLWKKSTKGFCLLHLKGCFNPKTLWWLSSLPAGLIQLAMWLFEASRLQEAQEA